MGSKDAEELLQALIEVPMPIVDWRACQSLHTAVFQVILNARPRLAGPCGDAWVEAWLVPENLGSCGLTPEAIIVFRRSSNLAVYIGSAGPRAEKFPLFAEIDMNHKVLVVDDSRSWHAW